MKRWRVGLAAVALIAAAACSSTPSSNANASKGEAVAAARGEVGSTTIAGGASPVAANAPTAPGRRAAAGGSAARGPGAGAASNPASAGDKSTLLIGAFTLEIKNAGGATGVALGDQPLENNALADYVNSHGGLAGHPIKVILATEDSTSGVPLEQQEQAGCVKFTEDNHVFAVVTATTTTSTFFNCLAKHRTPVFIATPYMLDHAAMTAFADLMFAVTPDMDRIGVTLADGLQRMGFFNGAKFALVYADGAYYVSAAAALKQQAAKYGLKPTDEAHICMACSTQDQASEANSAVVRFRSKGVDHVVLVDGIVSFPYLQAEQAQSFFPVAALTSNAVPEATALNTSPAALANAVGIGWTPAADMDAAHDGPENQTPQRKLCLDTMRKAGQDFTSPLAEVNALYNCDIYFLMKAVVDRAGRADLAALRGAAESLGDSYAPMITWSSYFGPNRHDGTQTWRPMKYDVGCRCWSYSGDRIPFTHLAGQAK